MSAPEHPGELSPSRCANCGAPVYLLMTAARRLAVVDRRAIPLHVVSPGERQGFDHEGVVQLGRLAGANVPAILTTDVREYHRCKR